MSPVAVFASKASKIGKYKQSCDDVTSTKMYQRPQRSGRLSSHSNQCDCCPSSQDGTKPSTRVIQSG